MIPGLRGALLSHDALLDAMSRSGAGAPAAGVRLRAARMLGGLHQLGPAHGARAVYDRVAEPLAAALGLRLCLEGADVPGILFAHAEAGGTASLAVVVTGWGRDPAEVWQAAVRLGISRDARWCLCLNGPALRVMDARRTYSRRFAEFDLDHALRDDTAFAALWMLLHAGALADPAGGALDRAVAASDQHRAAVRASLQLGVHAALSQLMAAFARTARRRPVPPGPGALFDESLTVVYRILFLLFAEARGLVPNWHPTYRDSYTLESLRPLVERRPRPAGLWDTLQAIARLAHRGCRAGELRVPPFNGRLFSPALAPLADSARLDDGAVREAVLALTTRPGRRGRERISYAELGVEQLGGVYERILDYQPAPRGAPVLVRGNARKTTGSFYTPRPLTEYLVRRTLAPLVRDATPEAVLSLRVLDPAMGSGAFLVAACRYLATAYEAALVREGVLPAGDISDRERADFRRAVAQRCLYGVDMNPMAVQLGRLSLWLATLSADKPLTFLDHQLRAGNSLVGASLADLARQPPGARPGRGRPAPLPLFAWADAGDAMAAVVGPRLAIAREPGDTLEQVRAKERALAALGGERAPLAGWTAVADLWCAGWFTAAGSLRPGTFHALADEILSRPASLPQAVAAPLREAAREAAARERFFHWTLEFPEAFFDADGHALPAAGFDAILGNPPWEMLRGDTGPGEARRAASTSAARLTAFARTSGVYGLQGDGHANLYQLFLERSLGLLRRGGRLGLVLPSGFATDHGCAALRRHVLDRTAVDACVSVENRHALFPIHRSLRFLLLCATAGGSTPALPYRSGVRTADALDRIPETGRDPAAVSLHRALLERLSGPQAAIPEIRSAADLALVSRLAFAHPALGDPDGWHAHFGRELNASDDRRHFVALRAGRPHLPIVAGKQVRPFAVDMPASTHGIARGRAARLLDPARTFGRPRLAYRDVSSATNRTTLIAAIVPAGAVTTHTLFCLKEDLPLDLQRFLCAVLNSFVANYLVRLRVTTHVSAGIVDRLPVPRPDAASPIVGELASLAAGLEATPADAAAGARHQAAAARLYGLSPDEFRHVLDTFPLVDAGFRRRCAEVHEGDDGHRG